MSQCVLIQISKCVLISNDVRIEHFNSHDWSDSQIFMIFAPANRTNHEIDSWFALQPRDSLCKFAGQIGTNITNQGIHIRPIHANRTNIYFLIHYIHPIRPANQWSIRSICSKSRFDSFNLLDSPWFALQVFPIRTCLLISGVHFRNLNFNTI